jgi:hypothetical protein
MFIINLNFHHSNVEEDGDVFRLKAKFIHSTKKNKHVKNYTTTTTPNA